MTKESSYQFLFFDADGTLLDFDKCEYVALGKTFEELGFFYDLHVHSVFNEVNKGLWGEFDQGKTTREKLLLDRFLIVFDKLNLPQVDPTFAEKTYRKYLDCQHFVFDGVFDLLRWLKHKYKLYIITNGVKTTQDRRLLESGLTPFFDGIFISDVIGINKPHKQFFEKAFCQIKDFRRDKSLVIGDSLTSDILGAYNAGVDACWINRDKKQNDKNIPVKYEFFDLNALYDVL